MAIFQYEKSCVQEANFTGTKTTTWNGKHVVSIGLVSSNLIEKATVLCNINPKKLTELFVDTIDGLARQSNIQISLKFLEIETSVHSRINQICSLPNKRCSRNEPVMEIEGGFIEEEKHDVSTQFLQTQKNQLIDLPYHLEIFCNVLTVFGLKSGKYGVSFIKSYTLLLRVNEGCIEPIVIMKANQVVFFEFGDVPSLDVLNCLGGARSLDASLKA